MARLTGPLMSVDASGPFGKVIVYAKCKGRNYARKLTRPKNPRSAKQLGIRAMTRFLMKAWSALIPQDKATFDALAAASQISPINAYVAFNHARWQENEAPSMRSPAAEATDPEAITSAALTAHANYVTAAVIPAANGNIWGTMVWRDTVEVVATWANCIAVYFTATTDAHTFTDSPLDPGTYHYRFAQFNWDGVLGTILADDSVVVPPP